MPLLVFFFRVPSSADDEDEEAKVEISSIVVILFVNVWGKKRIEDDGGERGAIDLCKTDSIFGPRYILRRCVGRPNNDRI